MASTSAVCGVLGATKLRLGNLKGVAGDGLVRTVAIKNTFLHFEEHGWIGEEDSHCSPSLSPSKSAPSLQGSSPAGLSLLLQSEENSSALSLASMPMPEIPDDATTLMIRNVPRCFTRDTLMAVLDRLGFKGKYDFIYLPIHFSSDAGFGYAFVNLVDPSVVGPFTARIHGFSDWGVESDLVAEVAWSSKLQGLDHHIERYRNSPVMHHDMPDKYKPIILKNGARVPFPKPTKRLAQPRLRRRARDQLRWCEKRKIWI